MTAEHPLPHYHSFAHEAAKRLGFSYDETSPEWVHPAMHLVLLLAPALLAVFAGYLLIRAFRLRRRPPSASQALPASGSVAGLDRNLLAHIVRTTRRQQFPLLVLSLSLLPVLYLSLELPKQIVNNVLSKSHAPLNLLGYDLSAAQHLAVLSGVFLLAITLNGAGKYLLNVLKGRLAERCLRRLRLHIYRHWRKQTGRTRKSELVQIPGQEAEPIGGFAADLAALPVTQGGTLLTILLFMFIQDPILGAAALTILPLQLFLLPYLQRIVNRLSRERIQEMRRLARSLAGQLNPELDYPGEVLATAAALRQLEAIRRRIHRVKFFAKALNNFLTALTPFLFYSLGGYFVLEERITLGALIAVLAAHKDFSAPLKELFRFYQQHEDTRIRYKEILIFLAGPDGAVKNTPDDCI
ncbi:ABC transporter transmembrane domain-containing protein [Leisingera sp. ANG-Vp]|uniref:ABC transporter transmembrane domain-containing protein n=1 Tax=Leisingera sp. ANG-Vp TaxID=1577896 RepID=UPI000A902DE4|nr:ABC transporter transmembrane domain-containing protein [Leisingera sp. ANG-Vp]